MKKMVLVFAVIFSFFVESCDKEDLTENLSVAKKYEVVLRSSCTSSSTRSTYCISELEHTKLKDIPFTGDPCIFVIVKTIDNISKSGYLASFGTSNGTCN